MYPHKRAFEKMIQRTDRDYAPWIRIKAKNRKKVCYNVFTCVESALEDALRREKAAYSPVIRTDDSIKPLPIKRLADYNPAVDSKTMNTSPR